MGDKWSRRSAKKKRLRAVCRHYLQALEDGNKEKARQEKREMKKLCGFLGWQKAQVEAELERAQKKIVHQKREIDELREQLADRED